MAETTSAPSLRELSEEPVAILYRNWRGEVAVRQIVPGAAARAFWFGSTEWHPEPQWLMTATDVEKGASRDFALSGILAWGAEAIAAREATLTEAVAAARAEGVREGLEAAAQNCEMRASVWRHHIGKPSGTPVDAQIAAVFDNAAQAIRGLPTPPITPGGRTDG